MSTSGAEKDRMRDLFARYVSPAVARQALERGIALGGESVQVSAMFVDLCGFTALTRRLPASRLVELLNEYYAIIERVCERQAGFIAQFLGDGVVVVFDSPLLPVEDHARRAVQTAIVLQRELAERNGGAGAEPIDVGIGICTGEVMAGNVGTGARVTYTFIGDAMNQAARLQEKTRECDASILFAASTHAAMGSAGDLPLRCYGATMLKGIAEPVEVYTVALA